MSSHVPSIPEPAPFGDPKAVERARLLLVEDEPVTLEFMRELLGPYYTLDAAPDGQAALEIIARGPLPDLILSDLAMPRLDGLGLLRTIRADPRTARIPVVLITAHDDEATRLVGLDEQADDFIGKPVRRRELYVRVRGALARARVRREAREREERLRAELAVARENVPGVGPSAEARGTLNDCEQRYLAIAGHTAAGVARIEPDGRIAEANARFCEIAGYAGGELLGRPLLEITHADDPAQGARLLGHVFAEGWPFELEKRCARKNGGHAWVSGRVSPLRGEDGRVGAALVLMFDHSGQHELRGRLRESEARLSAMFAQTAVGVSEITLEGRFLHVNDHLCHMLGRTRAELLAADVSVVTHPEDGPNTRRAFQALVETGEPVTIAKRYLRADGTVIHAHSSLTRLNDGWGRPRGVLAMTIDVSGRGPAA